MKILSVEITNITSIEGPFTINFEDKIFNNIGLFGITGPVGAGKSSIIDAICLGLYDTTPRLDRNNNNTNIKYESETLSIGNSSNLLRRGAASGQVTVRFTGIDQNVWRSNWMIRRSRNKADGKLQAVSMTLFNETENIEFPETRITNVKTKIQELIGLDFKQFTKSVILAQGDFQAFLNASDTERAQILEKLTGTEIYSDISKEIYSKSEEVKNTFLAIENQISTLQLLSDDELENLKNKVLELENTISDLNKTENNLKTDLKWFETLDDLNKNLDLKKEELTKTEQQILTLIPNFEIVKRIDKIADIKPVFLDVNELSTQNQILEKAIKEITSDLKVLDENLNKTKLEITQSENLKTKILSEIQNNEPLYKKARELDIDINRIKVSISEIKNEINLHTENLKSEETKIHQKNTELKTNTDTLQNIENWFTTNKNVKNWTENKSLLVNQFDQLNKTFFELNKLLDNHKIVNQSLNSETENQKKLEEKLVQLTKKQQILVSEIDTEKLKNNSKNIDTFLAIQNTLNQQISACKSYKLLASSYIKLNKNISNNSIEIQKNKKDILVLEDVVLKTESEITITKTKLQEQQIFVNKLQLESTNNVQHLRSLLQPNTECPVCGSTDHYVEKVTVLNSILKDAEKELTDLQQQLEILQKNFIENESKIKLLKQSNNNLIKSNSQTENEISQIINDWNLNTKLEININLKQDNVLEILNDFEKLSLKKNEELKIDIETFNQIQKIIDFKEVEVKNIQQEIKTTETQIANVNLSVQKYTSQQNQIKLTGEKLRGEETEIKKQISEILNADTWFDVYQKNPENVTNEVFAKIESWLSYEKHQMELQQNCNSLNLEIGNLKSKTEQIGLVISDKNKKLATENETLIFKINERKSFFNGEDVDLVENKIKTELESVINKISDISEKSHEIGKNVSSKKAVEKEKSEQKLNNANLITVKNQKIEDFISNFNQENEVKLNHDEIQKLSNISNDWILNIRNNYNEISQNKSVIKGAIKMVSDQILKHSESKPNKNVTEINELIITNVEFLKQNNENLIESKGVLVNQNNNQNAKTDLLNKKEKLYPDYVEWNNINSLLGSSNGDKLKKLAQQFTLDLLLQAANAQLQQINNRYILERIEESLSIMVIDQFMANTKRGTNSLSGGETFLVSLALSLALSTVSSTQLKVESLFIDEGFGNLDPNSLETAFLALENLQNQGRTIGIISHLDTVIDRLALKINVLPTGNGKSIIEITS